MLWTDDQTLSMAVMFLAGAALALFYDLCALVAGRADRGDGPRRPAVDTRVSLWDLLIWLVATPLVFAAALVSNRGELRVFVFVGLAGGILAYVVFGRPLVVGAGLATRRALGRGIAGSYRVLRAPLLRVAGRSRQTTGRVAAWLDRIRRAPRPLSGRWRRLVDRVRAGFRRPPGK